VIRALLLALLVLAGCGGDPSEPAAPEAVTSALVGTWKNGPASWAFTAAGTYTYVHPYGTPPGGASGAYSASASTITIDDGSPAGLPMPYALVPCSTTDVARPSSAVDCLILSAIPYYRAQ
jgi:hypothetical protein